MRKGVTVKVVLDANWYVSACINRKSRRTLYQYILKNVGIKAYYSQELLTEFADVISRAKFRKYVTLEQAERLKAIVLRFVIKVHIDSQPCVARDVCDNYLLGLCESCRAHYLVSGDRDLLILRSHKAISILTMGQFIQVVGVIH
ncbi:putative toxin-antitoxin system toxin component, PIN family [Dyadobacter jiangsuensis]|uniref:Putative PIN family toxin of toxin-antitoxin system n=1 Tax=Dyadobacter jiangsuensis TaxID=1591085 RepID=A0A2P8G8J0_9BACT|nr:putative toxin-antitoxin system toxin component, PIN family [Dyadobacter jiangsuensis]PSL30293.1 putative PIN family toxin of toxin-antitoxin system [Dyadobacter jiangsuensis]